MLPDKVVVSLVSSFFLLQAPSNRVRTSRAGMRWASPITPRWEGLFWRPGWGLHCISAVQSGWEACYDSRLKGSRKILSRIFQKLTPIPGDVKFFAVFWIVEADS